MSLKNALIKNVKSMKELKKAIDEQNEQTKIEMMLEEQRKLLAQYDNDLCRKKVVWLMKIYLL